MTEKQFNALAATFKTEGRKHLLPVYIKKIIYAYEDSEKIDYCIAISHQLAPIMYEPFVVNECKNYQDVLRILNHTTYMATSYKPENHATGKILDR